MILARVDGHTTASIAHRSLKGQKIVLCSPVDESRVWFVDAPIAAIDPIGAGRHAQVIHQHRWILDTGVPRRSQIARAQSNHVASSIPSSHETRQSHWTRHA
jgi:microcompartment protein CcmK/EutM